MFKKKDRKRHTKGIQRNIIKDSLYIPLICFRKINRTPASRTDTSSIIKMRRQYTHFFFFDSLCWLVRLDTLFGFASYKNRELSQVIAAY